MRNDTPPRGDRTGPAKTPLGSHGNRTVAPAALVIAEVVSGSAGQLPNWVHVVRPGSRPACSCGQQQHDGRAADLLLRIGASQALEVRNPDDGGLIARVTVPSGSVANWGSVIRHLTEGVFSTGLIGYSADDLLAVLKEGREFVFFETKANTYEYLLSVLSELASTRGLGACHLAIRGGADISLRDINRIAERYGQVVRATSSFVFYTVIDEAMTDVSTSVIVAA